MKYRFILFLLFLLTASSLLTGCTVVAPTRAINQMEPQAQANTPIEPVASQVPGPTTLPRQSKKAYLTFDDGPNSHFTGPILDILKRYDVKATFVVVGRNIERNPEVFKRILDEGHGVVNHTYSHDYNNIYASPASFLADLERCNRCIAPAGGDKSKIFRAPGGPSKLSKSFYSVLRGSGYKSLDWNVSSADSDPNGVTPEQLINNVENGVIRMEQMEKVPIILMHDGTEVSLVEAEPGSAAHRYIRNRKSDVLALPVIIQILQARGYTFAVVDENTPPAW